MATRGIAPRLYGGAAMALAAAAPGWFLWKHFPPLLGVFLACGLLLGGWLVGGAIAANRARWRVAAMGAATALLSFPIIGFAIGLGEDCRETGLAFECLSLDGAAAKTATLVIDEAQKSLAPVAVFGALAGVVADALWRVFSRRA